MARKPNGIVIYEGPSALDGQPIVVIVTGLAEATANEKTGDMLQTWILRSDIPPVEAVRTGADASICGDCIHRSNPATGKRSCYVLVWQAPRMIWEAYKRGRYPRVTLDEAADICAGRMVRIGSYGDPAATALALWRGLIRKALGWTGYSHQWRKLGASWAALVMASADSVDDMTLAHSRGWRTFRTTAKAFEHVRGVEAVCPASKERGAVTTCAQCRSCMGTASTASRSIQIAMH
jgi:hypothetical protein